VYSEDAPRNSEHAVAVAMCACSDTDDAVPLSKEDANGDRVVFYRFPESRQRDEEYTSVAFDWRSLQLWENCPTHPMQGNPCIARRLMAKPPSSPSLASYSSIVEVVRLYPPAQRIMLALNGRSQPS